MADTEVDHISKLLEELQLNHGINEPVSSETKTKHVPVKTTTVEDDLKSHFLNPSNVLPWDLLDLMQEIPQHDNTEMYDSLLQLPEPVSRVQYRLKRRGIEGKVESYSEEANRIDIANSNAASSISIKRAYGESNSFRGSTSQLPFQPGGIQLKDANKDTTKALHRDADGLFDIAQGLTRGLDVGGSALKDLDELENVRGEEDEGDYRSVAETDDIPLEAVQEELPSSDGFEKEIDELLPVGINFGRSAVVNRDEVIVKKEWAHTVDLNHKIENFHELIPNMARTWPFELDTFQQEAVYHLEQGDSVFVAAHTSAGKTVVAEYAIAMANRNMTKAIYTSPIKALSNQKFRDFKETFPEVDVGLITGDVQINAEANCLIMTTEILRSMLYRGADLIRDVEFIIFDEVHYVNDIDRGVVWEEVIIMLPDHVKFILLSATVPNTYEFANWIGRTKHKDIYVISTPKRPIPLEINVWGKSKLTKIIDADRKFLETNYNNYVELFEGKAKLNGNQGSSVGRGGRGGVGDVPNSRGGRGGNSGGRGGNRGGRGGSRGGTGNNMRFVTSRPNKNTWVELVQFLNSNKLLPTVIFVFSKARCEEYANTLKGVDFCNAREKSQIHMFIDKAVARLKKEDRELPQILAVRDLLGRGIAVHHGGLLPIVKEVIEILFAKTLIKVLFATETFAMGLNLPTKTVVFSELRKHDGTGFRNLLPGEFTQMSGRAGRRGLDTIGTVIIMSYTEQVERAKIKEVCLGTATKLVSQFRLTYNMILNLLRIEALRVEEMIKHSFSENSAQTLMPEHEQKVKELESKLQQIPPLRINEAFTEEQLGDIFNDMVQYKHLTKALLRESINSPIFVKQFRPGRLIVFKDRSGLSRLGVIFRQDRMKNATFIVFVFQMGEAENQQVTGIPYISSLPSFISANFTKMMYSGGLKLEEVQLDQIELVIAYAISVQDLVRTTDPAVTENFRANITKAIKFQSRFNEIDWVSFGTLKINEIVQERTELVKKIAQSPCIGSKNFKEYFMILNAKHEIMNEIERLKSYLADENLELLPDYEQRLAVLKELGFIDENLNVMLKGRVACEINCGWELILTELVLDNFLGDFDPEEIVALLSAFVYEGKTSQDEDPKITPRLDRGKAKIEEIMGNMMDVFDRHQVTLTSEEQDFLERRRFALVNVVYEWARGMTFKEIMELSVEAEGTIVRVITRLDEICREVKSAALIIGDSALHAKMTTAQEKIKRDIVFAASLYL
jgi:antiviral helicase SKI2